MRLKFSVVMPVYNRSQTVARALNSLRNQNYDNFEVIIVDDGSVDDSVSIIEAFLQDQRFRLIRLPENCGVNVARNTGLANISADSQWVTFLDSDDEFLPDALEKMQTAIQLAPDVADFCFAVEYADGRVGSHLQSDSTDYQLDSLLDAQQKPLGEWVHLLKADLIRQGIFCYETKVRNGFEAIAYLRLARLVPVRYVPQVVRRYHLDVEGLTRIRRKTAAKALDEINGYSSYLAEFGALLRLKNSAEYVLLCCVLAKSLLEVGQLQQAIRLTMQAMVLRPVELRIYRNLLLVLPVFVLRLFNKKLVG